MWAEKKTHENVNFIDSKLGSMNSETLTALSSESWDDVVSHMLETVNAEQVTY